MNYIIVDLFTYLSSYDSWAAQVDCLGLELDEIWQSREIIYLFNKYYVPASVPHTGDRKFMRQAKSPKSLF